jgi:putative hydrolase of the HAD superfamily
MPAEAGMMVFFDLDATLLDHEAAVRGGLARFLDAFGEAIPGGSADFFPRWEAVADKYLQSTEAGKALSYPEQRRRRMDEIFSAELSVDEAARRFQVYLDGYEAHWSLYPDVRPCLERLKGHGLGLITNGEGAQQRDKVARLGLAGLLSPLVISREVGLAKPQKEIFELAARLAGVALKDCVFVGDRLDSDAQAAAAAGMAGVWLNRKDLSEGAGIATLHGLGALPEFVQSLEQK